MRGDVYLGERERVVCVCEFVGVRYKRVGVSASVRSISMHPPARSGASASTRTPPQPASPSSRRMQRPGMLNIFSTYQHWHCQVVRLDTSARSVSVNSLRECVRVCVRSCVCERERERENASV